jgi:hypothetical protein
MAFAFEKLVVYQKSVTFTDSVCSLTRDLPRGYLLLANQLSHVGRGSTPNHTNRLLRRLATERRWYP